MIAGKCYPPTVVDANWLFCPSAVAAVTFSALFGASTILHCLQALVHRRPFAVIGITGGIWETCGYVFRTLSVHDQLNPAFYDVQFLLLLLAPLWVNAYVFMVLGRMVHFYLIDDKVFGLKARNITAFFVALDLTAFGMQAAGATMAIVALTTAAQFAGIHVYIGGICLQMLFNVICIAFSVRFQILLRHQGRMPPQSPDHAALDYGRQRNQKSAIWLLSAVYSSLSIIILRNIYRAIEYSFGLVSTITTHEWYIYVFDATPMLSILVAFNVFNPGRFMQGPRSDFSEENKERKVAKKARKMLKAEKKLEMKRLRTGMEAVPERQLVIEDETMGEDRHRWWYALTQWRRLHKKLRPGWAKFF